MDNAVVEPDPSLTPSPMLDLVYFENDRHIVIQKMYTFYPNPSPHNTNLGYN